jgi:hypothetical protein
VPPASIFSHSSEVIEKSPLVQLVFHQMSDGAHHSDALAMRRMAIDEQPTQVAALAALNAGAAKPECGREAGR